MTSNDSTGAADSGRPAGSDGSLPTCFCGHDRHHYMVSPVPTYTRWGTFWVIFVGVSTVPIRVDFQCRVCNATFDFTEDPVQLKQFM